MPNSELIVFLDSVRQSVAEAGYLLNLPADVGDHNGLSNMDTTRAYVASAILPKTGALLHEFVPNEHNYKFSTKYSRADTKPTTRVLQPLGDGPDHKVTAGLLKPTWMAPRDLEPRHLADEIRNLRGSTSEADRLRFVRAKPLYENTLLGLDPHEYTLELESYLHDPKASDEVRKQSFFGLMLTSYKTEPYLLFGLIDALSDSLKQKIRGDILQWKSSSSEEKKALVEKLNGTFNELRRTSNGNQLSLKGYSNFNAKAATNMLALLGPNAGGAEPVLNRAAYSSKGSQMVAFLLKQPGIDPNAPDEKGRTPLHIALDRGEEESIKLLLADSRTDVNAPANNETRLTPLQVALQSKEPSKVIALLRSPKLNLQRKAGTRSDLTYAFDGGFAPAAALVRRARGRGIHPDLINDKTFPDLLSLLKDNDDSTAWKDQIFLAAIRYGQTTFIIDQMVRQFKPDQIAHYITLVQASGIKGNPENARLEGALYSFVDNFSFYFNYSSAQIEKLVSIVDRLIDLRTPTPNGLTHLEKTFTLKRMDLALEILKRYPEEVGKRSNQGVPIIYFAADQLKPAQFVKLLQTPGLDVSLKDSQDQNVLYHAIIYDQLKIIPALLARKDLNINSQDKKGNTALHEAVIVESRSMIRLLVNTPGIDLNIKNKEGQTARDLIQNRSIDAKKRPGLIKAFTEKPWFWNQYFRK